MTDPENKRTFSPINFAIDKAAQPVDSEEQEDLEEDDDDDVSIDDEFRNLYNDVRSMRERWLRLAKQREEEKDTSAAQVLRLIAGDILPLITDVIAATGGGFAEVEQNIAEGSGGSNLTEDEVVQVYLTLLSNVQAFRKMSEGTSDASAKAALEKMVSLNESTMEMLRETFGDEIAEAAEEQLKEAAEA